MLGEMPSSESYKKRNYYMVEQAGHMIAVYDNAHNMRSGTQQTVNYAKKKGLQIIYIHPVTAQVTEEDINIGISLKKGNTELQEAINSVLSKMTKDDFSSMMDFPGRCRDRRWYGETV